VERLADGTFQFTYTNGSGRAYSVYGSTNLSTWDAIGAATQVSPGLFQFSDPAGTSAQQRFYELRSP